MELNNKTQQDKLKQKEVRATSTAKRKYVFLNAIFLNFANFLKKTFQI